MRKKGRKKEFDTFQKSIDPRETVFLEGTIAAKPTHACNASPVQGTNELALFKTEMWVRCPPLPPACPFLPREEKAEETTGWKPRRRGEEEEGRQTLSTSQPR